jgi:hypothetical protein
MTVTDPPDWAAVRHRYEATQDAVEEICTAHGVTPSALASRRRREGWRRANPRPFPPPRKSAGPTSQTPAAAPPTAPAAPSRKPRRTPPATGRRRLLERMVAAISLKLEQLERRMTDDLAALAAGDATATDHERETRAIGALIDNLGKITEIEADLERPAGTKHGPAPASDLADEAERCRRELAERLSRLVAAAAGAP